MRAPTISPAPKVEVERSIASIRARRASPGRQRAQRGATAEFGDGAPKQVFVGERAQNVGHGQPGWKGQLHAIDQDRGVEHAEADAEHADAQHVQNELPGRRLGRPSHASAWIRTAIALMLATEAATVCM